MQNSPSVQQPTSESFDTTHDFYCFFVGVLLIVRERNKILLRDFPAVPKEGFGSAI